MKPFKQTWGILTNIPDGLHMYTDDVYISSSVYIDLHMQSIWDVCQYTPSLFEWFHIVGGQLICW
jgi:hypothetical protein